MFRLLGTTHVGTGFLSHSHMQGIPFGVLICPLWLPCQKADIATIHAFTAGRPGRAHVETKREAPPSNKHVVLRDGILHDPGLTKQTLKMKTLSVQKGCAKGLLFAFGKIQ